MVSCRFFNRFCNVHVTPYRAAVILTFCWDGDDADSMALRFAWMTAARLIFLFWDPLDCFGGLCVGDGKRFGHSLLL